MTQDLTSAPDTDAEPRFDASNESILAALGDPELDDAPAALDTPTPAPAGSSADDPAAPAPADADPEAVSDAPADPSAPPPDAVAPLSTTTTEPQAAEPFAFTVDGSRVEIAGVVKRGDEISMPIKVFEEQLRPKYMANRDEWRRKEAGYVQRIRDAEASQKTPVAREAEAAEILSRMQAALAEPDDQASFEAWEKLRRGFPVALAEAKARHFEQLATRGTEREQGEQQQRVVGRVEEIVREGLDGYVAHYLAQPKYAGLNRTKLTALLTGMAGQIFQPTQEWVPDEQNPGLNLPRIDVNFAAIERVLDLEAQDRDTHLATLKKIEAAAKANAKAQAPRAPAPPALSAKGTPSGAVKQGQPKTKRDMDALLDDLANSEID